MKAPRRSYALGIIGMILLLAFSACSHKTDDPVSQEITGKTIDNPEQTTEIVDVPAIEPADEQNIHSIFSEEDGEVKPPIIPT